MDSGSKGHSGLSKITKSDNKDQGSNERESGPTGPITLVRDFEVANPELWQIQTAPSIIESARDSLAFLKSDYFLSHLTRLEDGRACFDKDDVVFKEFI